MRGENQGQSFSNSLKQPNIIFNRKHEGWISIKQPLKEFDRLQPAVGVKDAYSLARKVATEYVAAVKVNGCVKIFLCWFQSRLRWL